VRFTAFFAVSAVLVACTETPSYFPPCVNNAPCVEEGGADASDGGGADAPSEATQNADAH
jgi:hypothetical protein